MKKKRIIVVSTDTILGAGVMNTLTQAKEFEVIRFDSEDQHDLILALNQHQPIAIIFSENYLVARSSLLPLLINNYPYLRIITVNADDNWVHAYMRKEIFLSQPADLAEIIRSEQDVYP